MSTGNDDAEDVIVGSSDDQPGQPQGSPSKSNMGIKFDDVKRRAVGIESTIEAHIEAAEWQAEERAAAVVAQAERQAEDIRKEAQSQVDGAREQVNELMRLRQALFASLRDTLNNFEDAIARSEESRSFTDAAATLSSRPGEEIPQVESTEARAGDDESVPEAPEASIEDGEDEEGREELSPGPMDGPVVEVRIEPLRDLQAAHTVLRAFDTLPVVNGVHLRSFEGETALLEAGGVDVNLLLGSMRAHLPVPFILRDASPGKLAVQVGEISDLG